MSHRTPSRLIALPAALVALAITVPAAGAATAPPASAADGALARALNFAVESR